jgi:hypothetical protein
LGGDARFGRKNHQPQRTQRTQRIDKLLWDKEYGDLKNFVQEFYFGAKHSACLVESRWLAERGNLRLKWTAKNYSTETSGQVLINSN